MNDKLKQSYEYERNFQKKKPDTTRYIRKFSFGPVQFESI